jgi:hypothetical protein
MRAMIAALLLATASTAQAAPLTVQMGETWLFTVKDGEPANATKAAPSAKPAKGQLMVTVRTLFGTNMIITNNSSTAYIYRAELFVSGEPSGARSCTLPANGLPVMEQWPQKADAVRISQFKSATEPGRC